MLTVLQLLSRVMWLAHERGLSVVNVDARSCSSRRTQAYVQSMRERIAEVLGVDLVV